MLQQVAIDCGEGQEAYQVVITGKDLDVFEKAKADPAVSGKQGEELVAAILASADILLVRRFKDGKLHDGINGEPGLLKYNDNGTLLALRHFRDGKLHDTANGELAALQFDHFSNKLVYAASFKEGKRMKKLTQAERDNYLAQPSRRKSPSAPGLRFKA